MNFRRLDPRRRRPGPNPRGEVINVPAVLSTGEKFLLRQAAVRLQDRFQGNLDTETIDRLMTDSLDRLMEKATTTWTVLLAERFAAERLRAMVRLRTSPDLRNPSVLFLCVHNAGRSQMAAGYTRLLSGGKVDVFSGGSEPAEGINQVAARAMLEKGINIKGELPQPWSDEIVRTADVVVTMGCGDACPVYPGKRYVDWEVDDPSGRTLDEVRSIRDDLERRVRTLLEELDVEPVW